MICETRRTVESRSDLEVGEAKCHDKLEAGSCQLLIIKHVCVSLAGLGVIALELVAALSTWDEEIIHIGGGVTR